MARGQTSAALNVLALLAGRASQHDGRGLVAGGRTGHRVVLPAPVDGDITTSWSPAERAAVEQMTSCSFVGTPAQVREGLTEFVRHTGVDEVIVSSSAHATVARRRSLELLTQTWFD